MTDLSIIIPVFNEEESLDTLYSELTNVLKKLKKSYEIIFVDDGSTDKSFRILNKIQEKDGNVRLTKFRRNSGKSAALSAGFKQSKGDVVFTLDADLQDDPKEIPKFLEKINDGYDLVVGWRFRRKDPLTKTLPSRIFNALTSLITGIGIHDFNCCFKAYRSEVIKNISIYGELHRYIPVLASWKGYSVGEIKVTHHPRRQGKSKYGVMRLIRGFLDLITVMFLVTYAKRPLHFFGFLGIISFILGFLSGVYLIFLKFASNQEISDRPLLILTVLMIIIGVQFISLGLLGEMITSKNEITEDESPDTEPAQ
jgi:glycosyltransferase involved in cell wall biosynthesis